MTSGLVRKVIDRAAKRPGDTAVVVDARTRDSAAGISYAELDTAARSTAAWLQEHCAPGERVLLLNSLGAEFVKNFIGCLYAGMVPIAAPIPEDRDHHLMQATGIAVDTDAGQVLTDSRHLSAVHNWISQDGLHDLMCVATDGMPLADPADWVPPDIQADDPALLCYRDTNGAEFSTTVISHGALGQGLERIRDAFELTSADRVLSWLPPDHYTGLLGLLAALSAGSTVVLMPTGDFMDDPGRWLELIDRHRITISGAPAFGYELCTEQVDAERLAGWDLSSWRHAYTASVPLDWDVLARFAEHFAPAGFRAPALRPVYCVPEATFLVACGPAGQPPQVRSVSVRALEKNALIPGTVNATTLVSRGRVRGLEVRIVDPATGAELPEQRIGEVWVRGAGRPASAGPGSGTAGEHDGSLRTGERGFLRTGDLGAFADGELFVVGRMRDRLTLRGRNLYPHDVEREIAALDEAFAGLPCSVFSVPSPRQELIVAQEVSASAMDSVELRRLACLVRSWLRKRTNARIGNVMFLRAGGLPAMNSGRVRRALLRELFLAQALDPLYEELDGDVRRRYWHRDRHDEKARHGVRSAN